MSKGRTSKARSTHTWRILHGVTNVNDWPSVKAAAETQIAYAKDAYRMTLELSGYEMRDGTVWGMFTRREAKGEALSRRCANCLHRWTADSRGQQRCGKEGVSQMTCEAARAIDGDCGPGGKHYTEDEEARYGR